MENSGMRWVIKGTQAMLSLRCIHLNDHWNHFMEYYIQQEQKYTYPDAPNNKPFFLKKIII